MRDVRGGANVDWTTLSPEAAWTLVEIAYPISCGLSEYEAARRLGTKTKWVRARLAELADELERLSIRG